MYTKDDYFGHNIYGYGLSDSEADFRAQLDIDEIDAQFNRILKWQGCEQTRHSEWSYSCQCHGIDAGPTGYSDWCDLRPTKVEPSDMQMWCDYDFMWSWQRRYYRLQWLADQMERYEDARNNLEYDFDDLDDEVFNLLYDRFDRFYGICIDAYTEAYEEAIEELCHVAQKLMSDSCDWAYSDEAAEEWVKEMNAEEEWRQEQERIRREKERKEQHERDFEGMVGQAAAFAAYEA